MAYNPFKRKGVTVRDTEKDFWDLNRSADLPEDFRSPLDAAKADPDAPSESPDVRNQLKRFGANINTVNKGGPAYGN